MLDDLIELILELVLDGAVEIAESKRTPMPVRIALAAVILVLLLGTVGLLLWAGIGSGSVMLTVLSIGLLIFFSVGIWLKIKKLQKKK